MSEYIKVSSLTYTQIGNHFNADEIPHAIMLGNVTLGYMEEVERDEDRMYFDYYISEYYYNRYQLACV
jgi:hypothetical protein